MKRSKTFQGYLRHSFRQISIEKSVANPKKLRIKIIVGRAKTLESHLKSSIISREAHKQLKLKSNASSCDGHFEIKF
jgi:hypothetical protein